VGYKILKRYYAALKRDNNYKKIISWFETAGVFARYKKTQSNCRIFGIG
jgi:hypothetical protein